MYCMVQQPVCCFPFDKLTQDVALVEINTMFSLCLLIIYDETNVLALDAFTKYML